MNDFNLNGYGFCNRQNPLNKSTWVTLLKPLHHLLIINML